MLNIKRYTINSDGTVVYVGSDDKYLYAINSATGTKIWRYTYISSSGRPIDNGGIIYSSPEISSDGSVIYFGTFDTYLYALKIK